MKRTIHLLDAPELTPRQIAQRKYQKSLKGRQANRRYQRKRRQDAAFRAAEVAKVAEWAKANRERLRVYKRVYGRMWRLRNVEKNRAYQREWNLVNRPGPAQLLQRSNLQNAKEST